jgi:hypothetical protein
MNTLRECFTYRNWTSKLRERGKFPPFEGAEDEHADFTFNDVKARFTLWLVSKGINEAKYWISDPPKYHVEVKAATRNIHEKMHWSVSQAQLVRSFFVQTAYLAFPYSS